ncbi:hypothetical protein RND81_05G145000 [Saponaria officinalis]|uniref:Ribosome biogenesis protein BOP1 homolog n=1 Tax=Saponaria officinalis TaxID=3572 RepID=A0AAW1KY84_SAPOF
MAAKKLNEKPKTKKKIQMNQVRINEEEEVEISRNSDFENDHEDSKGKFADAEVDGNCSVSLSIYSDDNLLDGGDQGHAGNGEDDNDSHHSVEESDSSDDEVGPRNTIGGVPLEFYKDEEHIGYDLSGKKLKKKDRKDKLDKFLASADDKKAWRKLMDDYNDEEVELTKDEIQLLNRILQGKTPHADMDPYPQYVDWAEGHKGHPLSNAPDPKRRFIPSKWESKKINKLVRAIRDGRIKLDVPKEEQQLYDLWDDNSASFEKTRGLSFIPPPKQKLPGHEESYNPSLEYIPTQEEIDSYELMYEEDRPKLIPRRYDSLRSIPAYNKALVERMERCLDLYMCPRVRKKRLNIDPESLKKKDLPKAKDLKPYPSVCYIEYKGHNGAVVSISPEASGQWIASGSSDGTVRVWEVATGRCIRTWEFDHAIQHVAWNPSPQLQILAVSVGPNVYIFDTKLGNDEEQKNIKDLFHFDKVNVEDKSGNTAFISWLPDDKHGGVKVQHFKTVSSVEWHRKGDYFSSVMPAGESRGVVLHQLSKKVSKKAEFKLHGLPVATAFHPNRSIFFIATKKNVRVYDLVKEKFIKNLNSKLREISCLAIHPGGDNVLVGSREGKWCWFDMDLSSEPYKKYKSHSKDITNVSFHRSYPLFASCSEDGQAYVYHGMVYSDLNQDPLLVPLIKFLGHSSSKERGVLDCKFHPRQPWLFTAGADSVIKLYCH